MATYQSQYTGAQIDKAVGAVLDGSMICDILYNVKETQNETETLASFVDVGLFDIEADGVTTITVAAGDVNSVEVTPIQFIKKVTVTGDVTDAISEMVVKDITHSYNRTRNKIAELALANGTSTYFSYGDITIGTTSPDGFPVFCSVHPFGDGEEKQSNAYYKPREVDETASVELFEGYINQLMSIMRNMKDENGEILGYEADTILTPNNATLEAIVRKAVNNQMRVVPLSRWTTPLDSIILFSSGANKAMEANMLFDFAPLTIEIAEEDGNKVYTGSAKFGVGFRTYKHMINFISIENGVTIPGVSVLP